MAKSGVDAHIYVHKQRKCASDPLSVHYAQSSCAPLRQYVKRKTYFGFYTVLTFFIGEQVKS